LQEKDTLVLDIETKNTLQEVGENNFDALEISLIGFFSYNQGNFFAFSENEIAEAVEIIKDAGMLIGFSISRFDLLVLQKHFGDSDIFSIPRFDILDEIEIALGKRVGLDILAKANLGYGKNGHSLDAAGLYRDNEIEKLKEYCLNDVKITKELYELIKKQRHLIIPQKNGKEATKLLLDPGF
jgi:DEAD/DEAH box helicase domain-containing protein